MAWIYLIIAGILEVVWALGLKYSHGFSEPTISTFTVLALLASFYFFSTAMKSIPIGTAYAIFTGIGAVGTVLVGMLFLGESRDIMRIAFVVLLIGGIIGLKVTSPPADEQQTEVN